MFVLSVNDFRKIFYTQQRVWVHMKNKVFRKILNFNRKRSPLARKINFAYVLPSNDFWTHKHPKREKEQEERVEGVS